jgi:mannose-6-phosphate isomerase-like protein (cupin superfamily)
VSNETWQTFDLKEIRQSLEQGKVSYKEFLRVPSLSCGLYHLPAGAQDMQSPHDEDEVYLVLAGRAQMKTNDELIDVTPGTVLYIKATETHSFFEIAEDMTLMVFFASQTPD